VKNSRISCLLAGAAALATLTPAQAQTAQNPEVERLRAEMQALQARLDAVEARATETAATATAAAAANQQAPDWTADTRIGGRVYWNLSRIEQKSDGVANPQNGLQTDVKRFYVTLDHKFDDMLSANLTTDFRYGSGGLSKDTALYVKKAYVQAKLAPEFFVRVGSADLPWVPFAEGIYGYRFVENVVVDRLKYGTSADWGVHVGGSFGDGLVSYAAAALNGAGYKTLARSSDTIDLEGRISVQPVRNLFVAVGGYSGKLGRSSAVAPTPHRATRVNALVGYTGKRVRGGVEYFAAKNWNNVTAAAEDRTSGWSVFGSYALTPKLALFGRYDWVDPDKDSNPELDGEYFNVGLDFQPISNVNLALVYKRERVEHGLIRSSSGTVGGAGKGSYDEIGLWTQFRF